MNAHAGIANPLSALKSVSAAQLHAIQRSLERYFNDGTEEEALLSVIALCRQMRGVFTMVELPEAAIFMEEMAIVAEVLHRRQRSEALDLDATRPDDAEALAPGGEELSLRVEQAKESLLQATLQAPRYLDWLQRDPSRPHFDLLPLINQLRESRLATPLTSGQLPSSAQSQDIRLLAKRRRSHLQRAQLTLLRNGDRSASLAQFSQSYRQLKEASPNRHLYEFWWLAEGFIKYLQGVPAAEPREVNALLRDLDKQLKLLATDAEIPTTADGPRAELMERLVALLSETERYRERLDYTPPIERSLEREGGHPEPALLELETLQHLGGLLVDLIGEVRNSLDRFFRDDERQTEVLEPLKPLLHTLDNVLVLLNLDLAADIVRRQWSDLQQWLNRDAAVEDSELYQMAGGLALVEEMLDSIDELSYSEVLTAKLDEAGTSKTHHNRAATDSVARLKAIQARRARSEAAYQAIAVIAPLRNALASPSGLADSALWQGLNRSLAMLEGVLVMLEGNDASQQLLSGLQTLSSLLARGGRIEDVNAFLSGFADVMVVLEYQLELLGAGRQQDVDTLNHALTQYHQLRASIMPTPGDELATPATAPSPVEGVERRVNAMEPTQEFMVSDDEQLAALREEWSKEAVEWEAARLRGAEEGPPLNALPPDNFDPDLLETFFEEARGEIAIIRDQLARWSNGDSARGDSLATLRRAFHTLKGSGRMAGANVISEVAWALERLLQQAMEEEHYAKHTLDAVRMRQCIAQSADDIERLIDADRSPEGDEARALSLFIQQVNALCEGRPGIVADAKAIGKRAAVAERAKFSLAESEEATAPTRAMVMLPEDTLDDPDLRETFFDEATEILAHLKLQLQEWEPASSVSGQTIAEIRRNFHTLKGSGRMVGANTIGEFAWSFEQLFNRIIEGELAPGRGARNAVERAVALLAAPIAAIRLPTDEELQRFAELMQQVDALREGQPSTLEEPAYPVDESSEASAGLIDTSAEALLDVEVLPLAPPEEAAELPPAEMAERVALPDPFEDLPSLKASTMASADDATAAEEGPLAAAPISAGRLPTDELDDPDLREVFFEEAHDVLAALNDQLQSWPVGGPVAHENLVEIRRAFHTLKGSGRMVGANAIGEFAWSFEQLLNGALDGQWRADEEVRQGIAAAVALLTPLVAAIRSPAAAEIAAMEELMGRIEALMAGLSQDEAPTALTPEATALEIAEPLTGDGDAPELPEEAAVASKAPFEEAAQSPLATEEEDDGGRSSATLILAPGMQRTSPSVTATMGSYDFGADEGDDELIQVFVSEAEEILNASDVTLQRWSTEPENQELLNDLRREMHTLKGSSRMAGFVTIGDLSHASESLLEALSKGELEVGSQWNQLIQRSLDQLSDMVARVRQGNDPGQSDDLVNELREQMAMALNGKLPEEVAAETLREESAAGAMSLTEYDADLLEGFLFEASEILDASDEALQRWSAEPDNPDALADLRREMHTLKGGARMTGIMTIGDLAHALESVLEAVVKGNLKSSDAPTQLIQRTFDTLNDMLSKVNEGSSPVAAEALIGELHALLGEEPAAKVGTGKVTAVVPVNSGPPSPAATRVKGNESETIRVSAILLNNLVNQMGESSIYRARVDQGVGDLRFSINELEQTVIRLRQQLRRLEIETEAQIAFRYEQSSTVYDRDEFDPLELDRFSELQQLSRSLMEIVDDLTNVQNSIEDQVQEMSFLLDQQAKVNKEIQQGLMRTRMVSFDSAVPRFRRVVRQAAQELSKRAELVLSGSESEIDRTILENMIAPLEHMLRNAVSHGIESTEQRRRAHKPEAGTITLDIRREGAELVLVLADDGGGLNYAAIRAKAEERGLLEPGQPATEQELVSFLLQSGFSTAQEVTQISGRGVGMDVLNATIKSMRGALLIQSEPGKGTTFVIRLPYSLAVTQALLVEVGNETYAVPLLSIEAIARLEEEHLQQYLSGQKVELEYGEHRYPIHNLGLLFGYQDSIARYDELVDRRPPALLFRSAESSAALQVDAVLGSQEIIVKPVSPQLYSVPGISGATVLGDGRVVVVLELAALVRNLSMGDSRQMVTDALRQAWRQQAAVDEQLTAMVVDDSITMRKVLARFLERLNIRVVVAKDGVEAVALLEQEVPDIAFLDIEMPRMDGFEVMTHIRNQAHLKDLPVIMVTSRSGEKHRERGRRLGVNDYLIKPYQEDEMIQSIHRVLAERGIELSA